jgi:hypothetical protein
VVARRSPASSDTAPKRWCGGRQPPPSLTRGTRWLSRRSSQPERRCWPLRSLPVTLLICAPDGRLMRQGHPTRASVTTSTADNGEGRYRPSPFHVRHCCKGSQISAGIAAAARLRSGRLRAKRLTPEDAAATTEQCVRPDRRPGPDPVGRGLAVRRRGLVAGRLGSAGGLRSGQPTTWLLALVSGLGRVAGGWPTSTGSWTATRPGRLCDGSSRTRASTGRRGRPLIRAQLS